jgi:hypothetical protein
MKKKILKCLYLYLSLFNASSVFSCTCVGEENITSGIKNSDIIISGVVISKQIFTIKDTINKFGSSSQPIYDIFEDTRIKYEIMVETVFKGKQIKNNISIITGDGNGDCGYNFKVGEKYIVYANLKNKLATEEPIRERFYYTNVCKRTKTINQNEIDQLLRYKKYKILYFIFNRGY